ncbi:MAG: hypothetical protein LW859_39355 [Anabaena sp. 49633_E8]|nr:hypothetical protein [Anabaena sp. 49633_E8]
MTIFSLDELKNLVQNPEYPCVSLYLPMEKLCYVVDSALHKKLRGEKAPLILAGVEYLLPIYRQANTYPYLAETGITGNAEILKMQELNHAVKMRGIEFCKMAETQSEYRIETTLHTVTYL